MKKEEWLEVLNQDLRELKALTLETRKMAEEAKNMANAAIETAKAANETAKAAQSQTEFSRLAFEEHLRWHSVPGWKRLIGIK